MTHPFDLPTAQAPTLAPLAASHARDEWEAECKALLLELWDDNLAETAFDCNVLGAAHLGSSGLVQRSVNHDGLALLQWNENDDNAASMRCLYRAWKSRNVQGRGLHFLRLYLQLTFPNQADVIQLWHSVDVDYPHGLRDPPTRRWWLHQVGEPGLRVDGAWGVGRLVPTDTWDERRLFPISYEGLWLTSRIRIRVQYDAYLRSSAELMRIIRSIIPARLVPEFAFLLSADVSHESTVETAHTFIIGPVINLWPTMLVTDPPEFIVRTVNPAVIRESRVEFSVSVTIPS